MQSPIWPAAWPEFRLLTSQLTQTSINDQTENQRGCYPSRPFPPDNRPNRTATIAPSLHHLIQLLIERLLIIIESISLTKQPQPSLPFPGRVAHAIPFPPIESRRRPPPPPPPPTSSAPPSDPRRAMQHGDYASSAPPAAGHYYPHQFAPNPPPHPASSAADAAPPTIPASYASAPPYSVGGYSISRRRPRPTRRRPSTPGTRRPTTIPTPRPTHRSRPRRRRRTTATRRRRRGRPRSMLRRRSPAPRRCPTTPRTTEATSRLLPRGTATMITWTRAPTRIAATAAPSRTGRAARRRRGRVPRCLMTTAGRLGPRREGRTSGPPVAAAVWVGALGKLRGLFQKQSLMRMLTVVRRSFGLNCCLRVPGALPMCFVRYDRIGQIIHHTCKI